MNHHAHLYDAVTALDKAEAQSTWSQARPHYREALAAMRRIIDSLGVDDVSVNPSCFQGLVQHLIYQIEELETAPVAGVVANEHTGDTDGPEGLSGQDADDSRRG